LFGIKYKQLFFTIQPTVFTPPKAGKEGKMRNSIRFPKIYGVQVQAVVPGLIWDDESQKPDEILLLPNDGPQGRTVEVLQLEPSLRPGPNGEEVVAALRPRHLRPEYYRVLTGERMGSEWTQVAVHPAEGSPLRPVRLWADQGRWIAVLRSPFAVVWANDRGRVRVLRTWLEPENRPDRVVQREAANFVSRAFLRREVGDRLLAGLREQLGDDLAGCAPAIAHALMKACGELPREAVFCLSRYGEKSPYLPEPPGQPAGSEAAETAEPEFTAVETMETTAEKGGEDA